MVFIIAEIGKNFIRVEDERPVAEYLSKAIELIKAAKEAGADAVKFQTHNYEDEQADIKVVSPHFNGADRFSWVKRNTLATPLEEFWKPLKKTCDDLGIIFFTTPMSRGAAQKISPLDPPLWKVGSGDLLDFVLLDYLRQSGKPIIISTGMSTLEEVDQTVAYIREKTDKLAILHCVSRYPCPPEELRLGTIPYLQQRYNLPTGFSDHSITIESAIAAVTFGATIIEKHFSLDRAAWGSDHKVSLLPEEFKALVTGIRRAEQEPKRSIMAKTKIMDEQEAVFRPIFRKTLVAAMDLPAGTVIEPQHVLAMRPQAFLAGYRSEQYPLIIGQTLKKNIGGKAPYSTEYFI